MIGLQIILFANSNIEIDEGKHTTAPGFDQRLKHAVLAIIFGAVLIQMYFFYGAARSGSFSPSSIFIYFDSYYFLGYLAICGVLGWAAGQDFLYWLKAKMDFWKFW